jgi:glucose-6-phosphate 1-epimerase
VAEPVVVETGNGGLPCARVRGARADAEIYLHGGHVTRWQPHGAEPVLFLSRRAMYAAGKAIRGGVPLVFPWFGPHPTDPQRPMHGFARTRPWRLLTTAPGPGGATVIELALEDDEATRALWPSAFSLRYRVAVGATLTLALEVVNTSTSPFTLETALHTYLAVGDVEAVSIHGLEAARYIDKTDGMARKRQGADALRLSDETDRIFVGTRERCVVDDPALRRRLVIDKAGSATTVVWNPWATKAASIADLEPDDWRRMVCVETANAADDALSLAPGARHVTSASLSVERRA